MLSIDKDTLLKVRTRLLKNTPRDIYIAGSLDLVKKVFQNAYIIPFVRWYKFAPVYKMISGDDLTQYKGLSYKDLAQIEGQVQSNVDSIKSQLEHALTVIPFTPSKKLYDSVTDWKIDEQKNVMAETGGLFTRNRYYYASDSTNVESKEFIKLLMANANAMSILLRGVHYESPCKFCSSIYNRISGDCELFNTDEYSKQTCQPRITFGAQMFEGDQFDLTEQLNLSKDLMKEIFQENSVDKMEV